MAAAVKPINPGGAAEAMTFRQTTFWPMFHRDVLLQYLCVRASVRALSSDFKLNYNNQSFKYERHKDVHELFNKNLHIINSRENRV